MEKVENIKRPLKKGEAALVPCITYESGKYLFITPVFNHFHSDKENGQKEGHYHADYRFIKHKANGDFPQAVSNHSRHIFLSNGSRLLKVGTGKLEYFALPVINETFTGITDVRLISKSKLKHKCIHKGKCPHRGFDLSQVSPVDGVITCPLHGLKFDSKTKQLLTQ